MKIILVLISIIEPLIMYRLFNVFLTIKAGKMFSALSLLALFFVCILPVQSGDVMNIIYAFLICLIAGIIFYKGVIVKRICAVLMLYTISVGIKMLAVRISYFISDDFELQGILQATIRSVILILVYYIIYNVVVWCKEVLSNKIWILMCIMSSASFISIIISILPFVFNTGIYYNLIVILVMTLYISGVLATFFVIKAIAQGETSEFLNKQLVMQMQYYVDMEENQNITRKILHDMKNHLGVINSFLYEGDTKGAQTYLDNVVDSMSSMAHRAFCENKVVNAIINNKYKRLVDLEIRTCIELCIPEQISISRSDLCSLFSNAIDNSIEACTKILDENSRYINIKSTVDKGYFVYEIQNSKVNQIKVSNRFITSKKNGMMHGYGIDNIKTVVDKYNGSMDIQYTEDAFKVLIIIKV